MKKITLLTALCAMLFACSTSNDKPVSEGTAEAGSKKEIVKDYDYFVKRISNDEEWMLKIEDRAKELNISVELCLTETAQKWADKNKTEEEKSYDYYLERIRNDEEWMLKIEAKAKELNISVDSSLSMTAHRWSNNDGVESELEQQIRVIKNTPKWIASVENTALERGISLDSMLVRTANHVINSRNKN